MDWWRVKSSAASSPSKNFDLAKEIQRTLQIRWRVVFGCWVSFFIVARFLKKCWFVAGRRRKGKEERERGKRERERHWC